MNIKKILLFPGAFLCMYFTHGQQLAIGTYNIIYNNPGDTGNLWVKRTPVVTALIRFHDFDIFGTQEVFKSQLGGACLPILIRVSILQIISLYWQILFTGNIFFI